MTPCDIAVAVPRRWNLARPCIDAILARTPAPFRLHLLDATGDAFVQTELARYASVHRDWLAVHRVSKSRGPVGLLNECLYRIASPVGAVVSMDTLVTDGWLEAMLRDFEAHPEAALVSPAVHAGGACELPMVPGTDAPRMAALARVYAEGRCAPVAQPESGCFAVRRDALLEYGYLDELYARQCDALDDFSARCRRGGATVVGCPSAYVYRKGDYDPDGPVSSGAIQKSRALYERRWGARLEEDRPPLFAEIESRISALPSADRAGRIDRPENDLRVSDPLHFLCILPTLNPYGGVISAVNLLNDLSLRGHRCTVVSMSRCDAHPHVLPIAPEWVEQWDQIPQTYAGDYDVVLATSWETVEYAAAIADQSDRAHAMYFIQDLEDTFYKEGDERQEKVRATYANIETKFAKTGYLCREMEALGWPIHRIRPGMNLDLFYPHDPDGTSGLTVLGMLRYGHKHRGYDLILETLERVHARRPNANLLLFGTEDIPPGAISFPHENAGRVPPMQLPWLYSRGDIFLELSRHHGFGRTGVEAMACGAAAVLSNSGGLDEYAVDGENALIVPVEDVDAATDAVCRLIDDAALRRRLVDRGFETVARYAEPMATADFLNVVYRTHPAFQRWKSITGAQAE